MNLNGHKYLLVDVFLEKIFYLVFYVAFITKFSIINPPFIQPLWSVRPLLFIASGEEIVFTLRVILFTATFVILMVRGRTLYLFQWAYLLATFLLVSLYYSNGAAFHSYSLCFYFLFVHLLLKPKVGNKASAQWGLVVIGACYFTSGFFKFSKAFKYYLQNGDLYPILNTLSEHIAYSSIEFFQLSSLQELLLNRCVIAGVLWILAILLELACCLIPFSLNYAAFWCLLLLAFHLGVYTVLGINFKLEMVMHGLLFTYFYFEQRDWGRLRLKWHFR